jgi:hypothetical protein
MNLDKNAASSFGIIGKENIFTCKSKKETALGKVPSISSVQLN